MPPNQTRLADLATSAAKARSRQRATIVAPRHRPTMAEAAHASHVGDIAADAASDRQPGEITFLVNRLESVIEEGCAAYDRLVFQLGPALAPNPPIDASIGGKDQDVEAAPETDMGKRLEGLIRLSSIHAASIRRLTERVAL